MSKKAKPCPEFDGLNLSLENQDWVAVEGTSSDFEKLGRIFLEFAQAEGLATRRILGDLDQQLADHT